MLSCVSLSKHSKSTCSQFPVFVLTLLTLSLVFLLSAGKAYPGQATLSWDPPTTNADGTSLTDLAGYKVYYGTSSGNYTQNIDADNVTTYTVTNLTDGLTYCFVVTAYDTSMNESSYSNEVCKTIPSTLQYTLTVTKAGAGSGTVTGAGAYNSGTTATVTALANTGSTFAGWSGDCSGTTSPATVLMNGAKTCTATFTLNTYTLTVNKAGAGSGTVTGAGAYNSGTTATVTALANTGSAFAGWSGDCSGTTSPATVLMNGAKTCTATFTLNTYTLTVNKAGAGSGTVTGAGAYNSGTTATVTALANTGSAFAGWSGDCSGTTSPATVLMNGAKTCTATFTLNTYTLTVNKAGAGSGTVTGAGAYNSGTTATVTALANTGSAFAGWSGDCSGTTSPATVLMNGAKTCTATFTLNTYTLTVNKAGAGSGTVTGAGAYNSGTTATVTALANTGSAFAGWSGDCSGTTSPATVLMNGAKTCTATFTLNTYTLTVNKAGAGSGTVTGAGAYNSGTTATVTALANTGSAFAGWSGDCSGTTSPATVLMNGAKTCTATFTLNTYTLTVNKAGAGSGTVTGAGAYNSGTTATVTALANTGSAFAGWSGDCSGTTSPATVLMNGAKTCTATFTLNTYTLTVNKAGAGSGTVTGAGAYNSGTTATVTALANTGSAFAGWSGDCSGTTSPATVLMNGAKTCTATFTLNTYTLTVNKAGAGSGTVTGAGAYNSGTTATVTALANTGSAFAGWSGDCSGTTSPATVLMNGAKTCTATFVAESTSSIDLPKTGQTISYVPGDDGYIQAGIEWPSQRFIDNGDGTVTDNLTGLMWLKDGGCIKESWSYAINAIADFNNKRGNYNCIEYAANYSDWRLPNVKELESLINYGASNSSTWLNSVGFANMKSSSYWSSTTDQGYTSKAWSVMMSDGRERSNFKSYSYYIAPVRTGTSGNPYELPKTGQTASYAIGDDGYIQAGIEWPNPMFTNNGDGTVTDNLTGLMWLKDGGCIKKSWNYAINAIADFNSNPGNYNCIEYAANYSDWRLPNVKELESLINYGSSNSATWLNTEGLADVKSSYYWSSTTYKGSVTQAWAMDMTKANMLLANKSYPYYAWPVRAGNAGGGQPAQQYTLTVNKSGTGSGTVTSTPAGINCGADCTYAYNAGTVVTLTASPNAGSIFAGWSGGGCTGTGTCTLTMDAAKAVTATFTLTTPATTYNLSVTKTGTGSGTVTSTPAGINCGADCTYAYNAGTVVTLTASPNAGSIFAGWSGDRCAGAETCTVTMNAAKTVTAIFNYIIKGR